MHISILYCLLTSYHFNVNKYRDFIFKNNVKDSIFEIRNEDGCIDLYNLSKNIDE